MKTRYQVWALLRSEDGGERWQPVTRRYERRQSAQKVVDALWLETRIEQTEGEDDE